MEQFAAPRASGAGHVDEQCGQEAGCHREANDSPQHLFRWDLQGWRKAGDAHESESAHEDHAQRPVGEKAPSSQALELHLDGSPRSLLTSTSRVHLRPLSPARADGGHDAVLSLVPRKVNTRTGLLADGSACLCYGSRPRLLSNTQLPSGPHRTSWN